MGINSTALTTELLSQILRLNMQQSNRKTTVLCNGNNWSFNISSSSVDRPVERAILAGALTECDHWFVQQELKSDKFNSPIPKLGKTRNTKEMRHSAAGEREMKNSQLSITHSTCYAEIHWAPSSALEVVSLPIFPVRLKHGLWWRFACGWMRRLLSVIVCLSWFSLAERENSFWGDILPL